MLQASVFVAAILCASVAEAQTVYACVRDGQRVFSDKPCEKTDQSAALHTIHTDRPQPPSAAVIATTEGVEAQRRFQQEADVRAQASAAAQTRVNPPPQGAGPTSYRCKAADGQVFYSHTECPAGIDPKLADREDRPGHFVKEMVRTRVESEVVDRATACREVAKSGITGRSGRKHDQTTDPYTREVHPNQDPCRGQ